MATDAGDLAVTKTAVGDRRGARWRVIAAKEFADHVSSVRFVVLLALLGLAASASVYAVAGEIRDVASDAAGAPGLFLKLFTIAPERIPSFLTLVGLLTPLLGIAFGFDAVNAERSQGTLPRLVAQPIYRDDVINGKFVGGLAVIALMLAALVALVAGIGIVRLGLVPNASELARLVVWLVVTVVYVGFWLAFATLCSVAMRRAATSALVAIAAWLTLTLFGGLLVGILADVFSPLPSEPTPEEVIANAQTEQRLARLSPAVLYDEATGVLLNPEARAIGFVLPQQVDRAVHSQLSLDQSLLLAWPQTVGIVALTVIGFAVAYVLFMRQEIRA